MNPYDAHEVLDPATSTRADHAATAAPPPDPGGEELSEPVPDLPSAPPPPGDWTERAKCRTPLPGWSRQEWVALFFPETGYSPLANAICVRCPVQPDCLAFALTIGVASDHGIWGATSERERARIRRRRGGVRCERCGVTFTRTKGQKYCTPSCARLAHNDQVNAEYHRRPLDNHVCPDCGLDFGDDGPRYAGHRRSEHGAA